MTSLRCHEWDIHQSYRRDRAAPPWIKVHRNLMQSSKWARLTDAEKGQLVSIWLLAADRDGEVPADPFLLRKICMLDAEPNLEKFIELGLLTSVGRQRDVKVTPARRQHDAPEAEEISDTDKKEQDAPRKRVAEVSQELPECIDPEVWADWVKFRTELKKKLTPSTIKKQITELVKWHGEGADPNEIISTSIRNGWQGLFPGDGNANTAANNSRTGKQALRPNLSQRAHAAAKWALEHGDF